MKWYVCRVTIYGPEYFVIDAETKELINHGKTLNLQSCFYIYKINIK